ncbi:MAG: hypothetical protein E3J21_20160 [Anaerolineales bacterium]|nr:MAG: hypothetical protein E3J21_20160 [Anaerolineales bacterium]
MKTRDRILFTALILVDHLLGTHLVEKELAHREAKVARYRAQMTELEKQLTRLEGLLGAINMRLCLLYLRERSLLLPERWLSFDPDDPEEDRGLDLVIEHLVKPRLATIEMDKVEEGHHVYHLQPDWAAIHAFFAEQQADLEPDMRGWLSELEP